MNEFKRGNRKYKVKEAIIAISVVILLSAAILTVCGVFGSKEENTDIPSKTDNNSTAHNKEKNSKNKNDTTENKFTPPSSDSSLNTGELSENSDKYTGQKGTGNYNYGEALQKSILFYDTQRSGDLPENVRCNWRGDSGLLDGSLEGIDLTGGMYDAGDNAKFNLPMSYTGTMLAWSVHEDKKSYEESGQLDYILDNIKWINDYLIKCHPEDDIYYYQVGDGNLDHAWWGPAEVMQMERPAFKVDKNKPGSTVVGETAASLASCSIIFRDIDKDYSEECLSHAKSLFEFAEETKSDSGYTAANGFYSSWSGFYDELAWSGAWLYLATGDKDYLKKSEEYFDLTEGNYKWAQCWDDVYIGTCLLLSEITNDKKYSQIMEKHLDYWTDGYDGERITYTPKGLAWLDQWGPLRYSTTEAFIALMYSDSKNCSKEKKDKYHDFGVAQIDYALGSSGRSYVVGFGENPPEHPHHRTAHSSWSDNLNEPDTHAHTLYGALVGGPDSNDNYEDTITNYITNEVACDYNAGFTGALARLYKEYGGQTLVDFGAVEIPDREELYVEATTNANGNDFTEIKAMIYNKTSWPSRVTDDLELRYFVDLSEVYSAGGSSDDIEVSLNYAQDTVSASLVPWNTENNIYYISVDFSGVKIYPGGQSAYKKEVQFRIKNKNGTWDPSNDFSYSDIEGSNGSSLSKATHFALYDGDTLVFGCEPDGNTNIPSSADNTSQETEPKVTAETSVTTQKPPENQSNQTDNFRVDLKQDKTSGNTNTITFEINITNTGDQPVPVNAINVLYFFTSEDTENNAINMFCDNSAIASPSSYRTVSGVLGTFSAYDGSDCDTVCTISSNDKSEINKNESLRLQIRISKSDWSDFNLSNDHSTGNAENIVITYDGNDILGKRP